MLIRLLLISLGIIWFVGCGAQEWKYAPILPICFVEEHPTTMVVELLDIVKPLKHDEILILPLYRDISIDKQIYKFVVWNPFVVNSTEEIEKELQKRGQRDKLARVIVWVPGYMPEGIQSSFRMQWTVSGQYMTIIELHKESDNLALTAAMKKLLNSSEFKIEDYVDTRCAYDVDKLIRAVEYSSAYTWNSIYNKHNKEKQRYVFWAFNKDTEIKLLIDMFAKKEIARFIEKQMIKFASNPVQERVKEAREKQKTEKETVEKTKQQTAGNSDTENTLLPNKENK